MSRPFTLEIGGIRFVVQAPAGLEVGMDGSRYGPFLSPGPPGPGRVEVAVELFLDEGPATAHLPLAFDSGGTWRAFRDPAELLLEFRDDAGRRLWLARLTPAAARVSVHCKGFAERVAREDAKRLPSPLYYPLDQLLMMCLLPYHDGVIVHSAGLRVGQAAAVFAGHSGAGKSTLVRLVAGRTDLLGLSDDRVVVREIDGAFRAFGTPWPGTEQVASRDDAALAAVAFLHQARETRLERIGPKAALGQLLRTASVPWFDAFGMARSLAVCDRLLARVPTYELHFRKHEEVGDHIAELFPARP